MADESQTSMRRTLGRYQLLARVARGGMGQVWLGRLQGARGFHKLVAVKTLLQQGDQTGRFERMMLEEARIAALIHHPNVVQTIELGEDDGALYLVMEWVDGDPLSHVLTKAQEKGGFPLPVAVNLISQMLRGLHAAHELCDDSGVPLGVVHRDVSPHNVLVTYTGVAKLVDFGIAKATKGSSQETATGEVKGKFAYMAPEQVLGGALDRRTDLFAAGIMLYTLTSGRHPFKHHNDAGVLHAITSEEPAPLPSSFSPDYPKELEAVVMRAISKDIESRFASAEEMRLALERAVPASVGLADSSVRSYLAELLGDRATARREAVRRALLRADAEVPVDGAPVFVAGGAQSAGSLRAVAIDGSGVVTVGATGSAVAGSGPILVGGPTVRRVDSKLPLVRSRRRYQVAFAGALAMAAGAVAVALFGLPRSEGVTGSSAPVTSLDAVAEAREPAPSVSSEPGRELEAPPHASDSAPDAGSEAQADRAPELETAAPVAPVRARQKPKARDELIAPDYAR